MEPLRCVTKPVVYLVLTGFCVLTLHLPIAQAALIGTDAVVNATQAKQARDQLRAVLDREDVKQKLLASGVSTDQVQARVDNLTDEEAKQLAQRIDQLPTGGDSLVGALVLVFLVLLITDILGFTNVFPFVKHPARH